MSKKASSIIQQLYRLSKDGQMAKFVDLVESSQVLRKLNDLDGYQTSTLIYAFYKLDIQQKDIWKSLEALYLKNKNDMNMHDTIMCGWAFLNIVHNPVVWEHLQDILKKSTSELVKQQEKGPNLGLLGYIMAQKGVVDQEFWARLEWVYRQTQHLQDERNYTLLIYSFSRVNINNPAVWVMFEDYLWKQDMSSFKFRNLMLIIYAYAKNEQGSDKLWDNFQNVIVKFNCFGRLDLNFIQWAFGRMKKGNYMFWDFMIKETVLKWDEFHIHDLEMMLNAYRSSIFGGDFTSEQRNKLMEKIAKMRIVKINAHRKRFALIDEIVAIGRAIESTGLEKSPLAESVSEKFFELLPDLNFRDYKFRLWRFKVFFQHSQGKFSEQIQNQLTDKLYHELKASSSEVSDLIQDTSKAQTDLMIDLIILGQCADCQSQTYWSSIALLYVNIKMDNHENYAFIGLQIYLNLETGDLKTQIMNKISCRSVISQNYGKVIIISSLKALTYEQPNPFIVNFLEYCKVCIELHHKKETNQMRFEYLNRVILTLLHKNDYTVPQDEYHLFRQDVEALYVNNCEKDKICESLVNGFLCWFSQPKKIPVQEITAGLQAFCQKSLKMSTYVSENLYNVEEIKNQKSELVRELTENNHEKDQSDFEEKFDNDFHKYLGKDR